MNTLKKWLIATTIILVVGNMIYHTVGRTYHIIAGSGEPTLLVGDRIWKNKFAYIFSDIQRGDHIIYDFVVNSNSESISITKRVIAKPGDTLEGKIEDGKTVIYLNGEKLIEPYLNTLPLIEVKRTTGFFPFNHIGPLSIPRFLQKKTETHRYVYDPSKPLDKQPYYYMSEETIVRNPDRSPRLLEAFTPNTDYQLGSNDTVDRFGPITIPEGKYWGMGDSRKNSGDSRNFGLIDRSLIRGRVSFILFSLDSEEAFWLFDLIKHPIDFWTKHVRWSRFFKNIK